MERVLVIAPHPDDELLGCGGTLLRHLAEGDAVHWLIVTRMTPETGFDPTAIEGRERLIETVAEAVGFTGVHRLDLPTTRLDTLPVAGIVSAMAGVVDTVRPTVVYLPWAEDVHTDHQVAATAARACTKWFRHPSVSRVLAYETLSETDFVLPPGRPFTPNYFVDIEPHLARKLELLTLYQEELGDFPFPRSPTAVEALARVRGAACGCRAAEAFQLLKAVRRRPPTDGQ
ncbi:MAG: PIG-L family deacetylase [Gammaproteobacteria bacterium]|nr:MAG: PIG-L family deacetylase [Gammaproteobacteria bacterium]